MKTPYFSPTFGSASRVVVCAALLAIPVLPSLTASSKTLPRKATTTKVGGTVMTAALPTVVGYNSIPGPLPPNVPSLGYQANQTSEFGDLIQFAGTFRALSSVTLLMSDWALASDFGSTSPTWSHPITLNLYNVDNSGPNPAPGSLIASRTSTFSIPWRPAADPTCPGGTAWRAGDNNCYNGLAFTISFDFTGVTVPNQIIYGVVYNTANYGPSPLGVAGPFESLNFGLAQVPPSVGSNPFPDTAYWNTITASDYADGGASGVGTFRRDTAWTPYSGAITFNMVLPFNTCLQDSTTGDFLQWSTSTGSYQFTHCGKNGFTLTGTGTVRMAGGMQMLTNKRSDRVISAGFNPGTLTGSANIVVVPAPGISTVYHINDTNPHSTCTCAF